MLYTNKYPMKFWTSWSDLLMEQIPFTASILRIEVRSQDVTVYSPNGKYYFVLDKECLIQNTCSDYVFLTNVGALHIVACPLEQSFFEITILPFGIYKKWNIIEHFRYYWQQKKVMDVFNRHIC